MSVWSGRHWLPEQNALSAFHRRTFPYLYPVTGKRALTEWTWPPNYTGYRDDQGTMLFAPAAPGSDATAVSP